MSTLARDRKTATELISRPTRRELREYFVGTTLRIIDDEFTDADIECDLDYSPGTNGQRRTRVEQYYRTLDFTKHTDVKKFLSVYKSALSALGICQGGWNEEIHNRTLATLTERIQRDGYDFVDGRLISRSSAVPSAPELRAEAVAMDAPYLSQQIDRIENEVDSDPRHAIGAAKELVETTCKTILRERGIEVNKKWDVMGLVKETRKQLKLVPDDIRDSAKAADTIKRLLNNLATITQNLAELRNNYGSGHGPDGKYVGLQPRHARLAAGSACVLAQFLFETHSERTEDE